jgi:NitT/TauT family transport system ATP-binding protein
MAQIRFEDITLAFGNNVIVENFNFNVADGEIVTFFGPSGCGKSSIMKLVLGINIPTEGSVKIGDFAAMQYKMPISYVPQDNELLPWLSVRNNIEIWSKNSSNSNLSSREALEMVDLLGHSDKLPAVLSGGMARRTALARGLATKSEILCFDEAMVGIEKSMRYKLLYNLRTYIKENNVTAIFISHDYEETIFLSDKILLFTPPPTTVSKTIDVVALSNNAERNNDFVGSSFFKEIYNQMLG